MSPELSSQKNVACDCSRLSSLTKRPNGEERGELGCIRKLSYSPRSNEKMMGEGAMEECTNHERNSHKRNRQLRRKAR